MFRIFGAGLPELQKRAPLGALLCFGTRFKLLLVLVIPRPFIKHDIQAFCTCLGRTIPHTACTERVATKGFGKESDLVPLKDTKVCASCDGNRLGGQRKEWHLQGCLDTSGSSQVLRWKWKYPENLFPTAILRFK